MMPWGAPVKLRRAIKGLAALLVLGFAVGVLTIDMRSTGNAAHKDFISYWSAGYLLLQHQNPYDAQAVFRLEKRAGFSESEPLIMRNPSYALLLAVPLGLLNPSTAVVLWSILLVACMVISVRLLWAIHHRPSDPVHLLVT